jgi:hypothetical protein
MLGSLPLPGVAAFLLKACNFVISPILPNERVIHCGNTPISELFVNFSQKPVF